jgi:probable F420-dependent oxidoreductase
MTSTASPRRFRFGVGAGWPKSPRNWLRHARQAEIHGYDVLTVSDHMADQLSPMLALVTATTVTSSIKLGTLVLCNSLRNPVIVAAEALTINAMSAGRMELGLGTGWKPSDYRASGMELRDATTRVESLANSLRIVKRHLDDTSFLPATSGAVRSSQRILVGGGSQALLTVAAQHADIISLGPATRRGQMMDQTMTLHATEKKIDLIQLAAGTRFPDIELNAVVFEVAVTSQWRSAAHDIAATRAGLDVTDVMASPHFLVGTVPQIVDKLTVLREVLGISYFKVPGRHLHHFAPVVAVLHSG